ncbi:MAG: phage scaffolding protein [Oscillospiraceae bacterium]|nr:phage scaffolding protein [Oscillospiraceae bacterium]
MADETNKTTPTDPPAAQAATQTYSADYVGALRSESAGHRTKAKAYEKELGNIRAAFGVKPDEDIGDVAARLATVNETALAKANERLIAAELKGLEGYDHALLAKLIDRSTLKVDDDGTVTGLKEAAESVAEQFPAVLKTSTEKPKQWAPGNPPAQDAPIDPSKMSYADFEKACADGKI